MSHHPDKCRDLPTRPTRPTQIEGSQMGECVDGASVPDPSASVPASVSKVESPDGASVASVASVFPGVYL